MAEISRYIQSIKLPVMPEVAHALIRTLNDDNANTTTVCAVIAHDPALTATLLRMANSALFGLSRTVHTLDAAVNVVGMSQLRARALSICMAKVFPMPAPLDRLAFWRYCMVSAGYARWLGAKAAVDEQQAWLVGMMLRLGQLTMAQQNNASLEHIEQLPRAPGERWVRERDLLGFDETAITAEIAHLWDFPESLVRALRSAGNPLAGEASRLGAVAHLAALLADHDQPDAQALDSLPIDVMAILDMDMAALRTSMPSVDSLSDTASLQG